MPSSVAVARWRALLVVFDLRRGAEIRRGDRRALSPTNGVDHGRNQLPRLVDARTAADQNRLAPDYQRGF